MNYYKIKVTKHNVLEDLTQALEYYSSKGYPKVELFMSYEGLSWLNVKCPEIVIKGTIKGDMHLNGSDVYVVCSDPTKDKLGGLFIKSSPQAHQYIDCGGSMGSNVAYYDSDKVEYNPQLDAFTVKDSFWERIFGWLR